MLSCIRPSFLALEARLVNHTTGIQYLRCGDLRFSKIFLSSIVMKPEKSIRQRLSQKPWPPNQPHQQQWSNGCGFIICSTALSIIWLDARAVLNMQFCFILTTQCFHFFPFPKILLQKEPKCTIWGPQLQSKQTRYQGALIAAKNQKRII